MVDRGFHNEALRLAVVLRTLLHDTLRQRSLLTQLGVDLDHATFWDTAIPLSGRKPGYARVGLLTMVLTEDHPYPRYSAPLGRNSFIEPRLTLFPAWWRQPVSHLGVGREFSRRDYVLAAADREGGAHVDPHLDPVYEAFVDDRFKGGEIELDEPVHSEGNGPALALRQITYEVERTLDDLPQTRP
jgi:hypothetical protein